MLTPIVSIPKSKQKKNQNPNTIQRVTLDFFYQNSSRKYGKSRNIMYLSNSNEIHLLPLFNSDEFQTPKLTFESSNQSTKKTNN